MRKIPALWGSDTGPSAWRARPARPLAALGPALAALLTAGCLGAGLDPAQADVRDDPPGLEETISTWSGRMVVSGGAELPAHFPETAPLVAPIWEGMRTFDVATAPALLEVRMEWTGAPGTQVQLMAEAPERDGEIHYWANPPPGEFTADQRLCVRVPFDALATGPWKMMPHTLAGADFSFTITVRTLGGIGAYTDEHQHWITLQEYLARKADDSFVGHATDACGG